MNYRKDLPDGGAMLTALCSIGVILMSPWLATVVQAQPIDVCSTLDTAAGSGFIVTFPDIGIITTSAVHTLDIRLEIDEQAGTARIVQYMATTEPILFPVSNGGVLSSGDTSFRILNSSGTYDPATQSFSTNDTYEMSFTGDLSSLGLISPTAIPAAVSTGTLTGGTSNPQRIDMVWTSSGLVVGGAVTNLVMKNFSVVVQACCLPDGSCADLTTSNCSIQGGTSQGTNTTCATIVCPQPTPTEACCLSGGCVDLQACECLIRGGLPQGFGTTCQITGCPPAACCFPDQTCQDLSLQGCLASGGFPSASFQPCTTVTCGPFEACCFLTTGQCFDAPPIDCLSLGGQPQGVGTTCVTTTCPLPPPTEACCLPNGTCGDMSVLSCSDAGGISQGSGTECITTTCEAFEACCDPVLGTCSDLPPILCVQQTGIPQGSGTNCATNNCPPPEACCFSNGCCVDAIPSACSSAGGTPQGPSSTCSTANCALDCNANGISDAIDIATGTSQDCNSNGALDECEIDVNSMAPGGPFFCTANCDPDCNNNGIPDACDIANCPGDPACGDCNNNGIPDSCDIASLLSNDVVDNMTGLALSGGDGIPDECINWNGGAPNTLWSDPVNWDAGRIPGIGNPTNIESPTININGTAVDLDVNVSVDSLVLGANSTLNISAANLTIDSPNGIHNDGTFNIDDTFSLIAFSYMIITGPLPIGMRGPTAKITSTALGDAITLVGTIAGQGIIDADLMNVGVIDGGPVAPVPNPGGRIATSSGTLQILGPMPKVNNGLFKARNGWTLLIGTDITGTGSYIADGGTIQVMPGAGGASIAGATMDVMAGALALSGGVQTSPGVVEVAGTASVTLTGALTVGDGGIYRGLAGASGTLSAGSVAINMGTGLCGGQVLLTDNMRLNTNGAIVIDGTGLPCTPVPCAPPILSLTGSASAAVVGNLSLNGLAQVDVTPGPAMNAPSLTLSGNFDNRSIDPTIFNWAAGTLTMNGVMQTFELAGENRGVSAAGFVDNFAIEGTLRVEAAATVNFVDAFDNIPGAGCEVLYVDTLSLGLGATIRLNGCYIFYRNLVDEGATIDPTGGGGLVCFNPGDVNCDGLIDMNDTASIVGALLNPSANPADTAASDLNGDGMTNGLDIQMLVNILLGL